MKGNCRLILIDRKEDKYLFRCRDCGNTYLSSYSDSKLFKASCRKAPPRQFNPATGPGTELVNLIDEEGLSRFGDCQGSCQEMAFQMDLWGPEECRANRQAIVDHLKAAANRAGWMAKSYGALTLIYKSWFSRRDPLGSMVDEAIRRSETRKFPVTVNLDRIGWGDLALFAYISLGTAETRRPLLIGATKEKARHAKLLGCEPVDPKQDQTEWTAFTAEMEYLYNGGTLGRLEFYADHYDVPRKFKKPTLTIPQEDMEFAYSLGINRNTVLFFPDSLSPNRVWPKIYWNKLADLLEKQGLRSLAFPVKGFEKHYNAVDARPIVRVAACMKLAGLGIGNDSALINWTPLVDLPSLCLLGPTCKEIFDHAPNIRCLTPRTPLPFNATPDHPAGEDCNGCCYHFKHNPFCSQTCMSLANMLPEEVAEEAVRYHKEVWSR